VKANDFAVIDGSEYEVHDGVAKRMLAPGVKPGKAVHVTTPASDEKLRKAGWRVAWIFLMAAAILLCLAPFLLRAIFSPTL
jgi:hypothetical protein